MNLNPFVVGFLTILILSGAIYFHGPSFVYKEGQTFCVENMTIDGRPNQFEVIVFKQVALKDKHLYVAGPNVGGRIPPVEFLALIDDNTIAYWIGKGVTCGSR